MRLDRIFMDGFLFGKRLAGDGDEKYAGKAGDRQETGCDPAAIGIGNPSLKGPGILGFGKNRAFQGMDFPFA